MMTDKDYEEKTFGKKITHPSFGIISISRGTCSHHMNLFGSSIKQKTFIQLNINRASLRRNLHRDNFFQEGVPIISVYMSPTQFADAITSLNSDGVPCTIDFVDGKPVKPPTIESKRLQFDREFEKEMSVIANKNNEFLKNIRNILSKKSIGKHDKQEIMKQLDMLNMQIESNIPFMKKQFTEQMDKTVVEAKNDFDDFVKNRLLSLGLDAKSLNGKSLIEKELRALEYREGENKE